MHQTENNGINRAAPIKCNLTSGAIVTAKTILKCTNYKVLPNPEHLQVMHANIANLSSIFNNHMKTAHAYLFLILYLPLSYP